MVYAPQATQTNHQDRGRPIILDPSVLRAAQRIYRTYCVLHPKKNKQPYGIAIHRKSHRGQLIFRENPVLLPGECFVPRNQLETEIY
ncbi:MAG TPA: hypothetical protein DCF68_10870 [Cyanothece sp. UBA12306]|nr:hypothetical protein [Cyanothece sp. UBA12306]